MIKVGTFTSNSGRLHISDPCYDKDTWCAGTVQNCVKGVWEAFVEKREVPDWGNRVSRLIVRAVGVEAEEGNDDLLNIDVGVDSGQAGIFDAELYKTDMSTPHLLTGNKEYELRSYEWRLNNEKDAFDGLGEIAGDNEKLAVLADIAKSRKETLIKTIEDYKARTPESSIEFYKVCCDKTLSNLGAGTVEYGAVSRSGFGDGSYAAFVERTADGRVCEISIEFISDEEL